MKMYRAVPKEGFDANKIYMRQSTRRTPTNVPYLVDNIWEFLRPDYAPSRRHAAYASPTPELALANASAVGADPSLYEVCEILVKGEVLLAHLQVTDARLHEDVSRIVRHVAKAHGAPFADLPIEEKAVHAALYLPGVSDDELGAYFCRRVQGEQLRWELQHTRNLCTFWKDASYEPQDHNGELFFELKKGSSYTLKPL
jgi:hypothetical protein